MCYQRYWVDEEEKKKEKEENGVTENGYIFVEKSVIYQRSISRLNAKDIETRVLETKGILK